MNPIIRIIGLFVSALALLAAIAVGAYQLSNIWVALAAVLLTSLLLSKLVNEAMAIGAYFEHRSMHHQPPDFEDTRFADSDVSDTIDSAASVVTDPDLQEAFHHFVHLAEGCAGSKGHAERLQVVLEHLQMRLTASQVQPMTAEERATVH